MRQKANPTLVVIMDGIGVNPDPYGNSIKHAYTPNLNFLAKNAWSGDLFAHGQYVGLPSALDMGNSEVGHNALGSGRVVDQGAKLVSEAISSGAVFESESWNNLIAFVGDKGTLHFLGLLSDGNVHSHENHLFGLIDGAVKAGKRKIRLHILVDGRDVAPKSAEVYAQRLFNKMNELGKAGIDIKVASGGGRMNITMDRYEADWQMVYRGWQTHVHGIGEHFPSFEAAIAAFRKDQELIDQYMPGFVIADAKGPVGPILDGDGVVLFNFRGDRAIEISQAFEEANFSAFDRGKVPNIFFAGMTQYEGDKKIPKNFLVSPPKLDYPLGEHLAALGIKQFACSETQKFGHVTYFWNGNRKGCFDQKTEIYTEIPSDNIHFDEKPWMKAQEITVATISRMQAKDFELGRINFANGDMVGHTGNFQAAVTAVSVVDQMIGRLLIAAKKYNYTLLITADHGNCDEMFQGDSKKYPDWQDPFHRPPPKTSHTLSKVPLYIYNAKCKTQIIANSDFGLANVANTLLDLLGLSPVNSYNPSVLR